MQGAQSESRYRGIGRYSLSFAHAIVRNRGDHEVILALSGLLHESIAPIRQSFMGLLPQSNIRVWHAPGPVCLRVAGNEARRERAERMREAFLLSLLPDVIHVTSMFEGHVDDAVTSIGLFDTQTPVSVSHYDMIPLMSPDIYLEPFPEYASYYESKVKHLRRSSICLSISESAANEGRVYSGLQEGRFVNVSTAADPMFAPRSVTSGEARNLLARFAINRPFVLCSGGIEARKNLQALFTAFASLPGSLRSAHQLVVIGRTPDAHVAMLRNLIRNAGLHEDEVCILGYVPDDDLVSLYSLCRLFVFPSTHEGFGLPALEAMSCGAATITSNTSSLPEVVGTPEAMFDPLSVSSICEKMSQALQDSDFRDQLRAHGLKRASLFSWDKTALRAIAAWEDIERERFDAIASALAPAPEARLLEALGQHAATADSAVIAPLAACIAQNQISGVQRQLFVDVSELSQRDSATGVQRVVRSYLRELLTHPPNGFRVEPVYATVDVGYRYARRFTSRFLGEEPESRVDPPMRWQRGDVFYGLDMQHDVQVRHAVFYAGLRRDGVIVRFQVYDLLPIQSEELFEFSAAGRRHADLLAMIAATDGAICISRTTAEAYEAWLNDAEIPRSPEFAIQWAHIGADIATDVVAGRTLPTTDPFDVAKIRQRTSFLCVATLEPRKRQSQILDACESLWDEGLDINLVLVGKPGWKTENLVKRLANHSENGKRLFWLDGIDDANLEQVYKASSALIAASINEGFGLPLIEAARHGKPLIVRDIPIFREVAGESAYYFEGNGRIDLANALKTWLRLYKSDGQPASHQLKWMSWRESSDELKEKLIDNACSRKQLLIDVSELAVRDARTGIQRVVRRILGEWLACPPASYRIEPVYATVDAGYRYAREFTQQFCGQKGDCVIDEPVEVAPGDVFLGLDFQPQVVPAHADFFAYMRQQGATVKFIVYDLLSLTLPNYFPAGASAAFQRWLRTAVGSDGIICISQSVAVEVQDWVSLHEVDQVESPSIDWFHLGSDFPSELSHEERTLTGNDAWVRNTANATVFLMVGTIEPRKGHRQVIAAFEELWRRNENVVLAIVGKSGWSVDDLVAGLSTHNELHRRLFWFEQMDDSALVELYRSCDCLIAASEGEGFGLPLAEAAHYGLPVVARDIPVFREVARSDTTFFHGNLPETLVVALTEWIAKKAERNAEFAAASILPTWRESADRLAALITAD